MDEKGGNPPSSPAAVEKQANEHTIDSTDSIAKRLGAAEIKSTFGFRWVGQMSTFVHKRGGQNFQHSVHVVYGCPFPYKNYLPRCFSYLIRIYSMIKNKP